MAILFRRSNGVYYLVTNHNGHRVWRSTGKRRRIDAEKYLRDAERQHEQKEETKSQHLTFSQLVPDVPRQDRSSSLMEIECRGLPGGHTSPHR